MEIKQALREAYKIGTEMQEKLDDIYFSIKISDTFAEFKDTDFFKGLSLEEKRIIEKLKNDLYIK